VGDRDVQQLEDTSTELGNYSYNTQKGVITQAILDVLSEYISGECYGIYSHYGKNCKISKKVLAIIELSYNIKYR
jgi:hypothetical protein